MNIIETKTFDFAKRIVKLNKYLKDNHKEFTLSHQLLRSGTSIGANVAEAEQAQSRNEILVEAFVGNRLSFSKGKYFYFVRL